MSRDAERAEGRPDAGSDRRFCPACRSGIEQFRPGGPRKRPNAKCPSCGALERHRFLAALLWRLAPWVGPAEAILDIAPQAQIRRVLTEIAPEAYVGVDLLEPRAIDVRADVTGLPFADDAFDLLVCYHVLEHIPDDRAAMRELARVLRPGGLALVQVPWRPAKVTDEDPHAPDAERVRRFGQVDHVRFYGGDVDDRLADSGFLPSRIQPSDLYSLAECRRMGLLPRETVWVCRTAGVRGGRPLDPRVLAPPEGLGDGIPLAGLAWEEVVRLRSASVGVRRELHERDRELRELRTQLERVRTVQGYIDGVTSHPASQRVAPVLRAARAAALRRRHDDDARVRIPLRGPGATHPLPYAPAAYRAALRGSLHAARTAEGDGVVVVGKASADVRRSLARFRADAGEAPPSQAEVVVVTDPDHNIHPLGRGPVSVALVTGEVEPWTAQGWFDDYDVVLTTSADGPERVREQSTRVATHVAATGDLADAVLTAVERWCEAVRYSVCVPTPDRRRINEWGDTFFGRAIQKELERAGHPSRMYLRNEYETPAAGRSDVSLDLLGLAVPPPRPGQLRAVWIISHPELVSPQLCDSYDLVLPASATYARELRAVVQTPVHALPQATDAELFHPDPTGPRHDLLFVGNSRWTRRHVIDDLTPTDLDLAIYGREWHSDLVDPRHVAGQAIPNTEVNRYYSSASIVLNDHWPEMAERGIVSNRIFDALASGAFIISDRAAGLDELFGGAVVSYRDRAELQQLVDHFLAHPAERRERAERGRRIVLDGHTFRHRAARIVELVEPLLPGRR